MKTTYRLPPTWPVRRSRLLRLLNVDRSTVTRAADLVVGLGDPFEETVYITTPTCWFTNANRAQLMHKLFFSFAAMALCVPSIVQAEMTCGIDHVVIDGVKIPYGAVVEVVGPWRWYKYFKEASPAVAALRINGSANDDDITVELVASKDGWTYEKLRGLDRGAYYKVRGPLMDAYDGPDKKFNIIVEHLESVDPAPLTVADFLDRATTLEGIAVEGSRLSVGNDQALLEGRPTWPPGAVGKRVVVQGTVRGQPGAWRIEEPQWRLVELADQLGQTVSLEGILVGWNGNWWFEYRKQKACLAGATGRRISFARGDPGRRVRVTGSLLRQDRPSLEQVGDKSDRELVSTFVIRGAEIEHLAPPPQPNHHLHRQPIRVKDGALLLVPETRHWGPLMGNETHARLFAERNHDVIVHIVRHATPKTCGVLARRMADPDVVPQLRLLYAAILACLNDPRGREFLLTNLEDRRSESFLDALYCAGMFAWLGQEKLIENAPPTDLTWAEKPLISVMLDVQRIPLQGKFGVLAKMEPHELPVADAAVVYSQIPSVLTVINSAAARTALLKYVAENHPVRRPTKEDDDEDSRPTFQELQADEVVAAICWRDELLPVDFLLQLEPLASLGSSGRARLLVQLLRHKHPAAAERFLDDLQGEYYEFVRYLSPEFATALRPHIPELHGGAKACAAMLDVLAREDPVPELLNMLDDDDWPVKRLVFHHLADLSDARAVKRVGEILKSAAPDFFDRGNSAHNRWSSWNYLDPVDCGLDAIAKAGTDESIKELTGLLRVDLSRFGHYYYRFGGKYKTDGYQRIVAAHLIDLTGESFGVDADKWQNWFNNRGALEQK